MKYYIYYIMKNLANIRFSYFFIFLQNSFVADQDKNIISLRNIISLVCIRIFFFLSLSLFILKLHNFQTRYSKIFYD